MARDIGVVLTLILAGAALAQPGLSAQTSIPAGLAALGGDWRFDPAQSDDLEAKLDEMRRGGPGGLTPRAGGVGGGAGRGGRGGAPGGGFGGPAAGSEAMGSLLRVPIQMSFDVSDSAVRMRVDLGLTRPLYLDGRTTVDTLSDMSERKSSARWKKDRLEVERRAGQFGRVREDYRVDPNTGLLLVRVTIEGPRKITLDRVYQPVSKAP